MLLTLSLLFLAAVFFWSGFLVPYHAWQYRSKAGFVAMLWGPQIMTGYLRAVGM